MEFDNKTEFRCACCGEMELVENLSEYCHSVGSPLCPRCEQAGIPNDGYQAEDNGIQVYYKNIEDITESDWEIIQEKWLQHLRNLCDDGIIPPEVVDDYLKGE